MILVKSSINRKLENFVALQVVIFVFPDRKKNIESRKGQGSGYHHGKTGVMRKDAAHVREHDQ